jgi:hypothetical protein
MRNFFKSTALIVLLFLSILPALAQPVRPILDTNTPTAEFEFNKRIKMAFKNDGIHLVVYTGKAYDDKSTVKMYLYNWHTGLPDTMAEINALREDFYKGYSQASSFNIPEPFAADLIDRTVFADGKKMARTEELVPHKHGALLEIWSMKKGNMDAVIKKKQLNEPDMTESLEIPVCPGMPVCALLSETQNGDYKDIIIYDMEADTVISKLVNFSKYRQYAAAQRQFPKDSADFVNAAIDKARQDSIRMTDSKKAEEQQFNELKKKVPRFIFVKNQQLALLQSEGWKIEKRVEGSDIWRNEFDSKFNWELTLQPGRMYTILIVTMDSRTSYNAFAYLDDDKETNLEKTVWGENNIYQTGIYNNSLLYTISRAVYVNKATRADLRTTIRCYGCGENRVDDGSAIYLLSRPKTNTGQIRLAALANKDIDVISLNHKDKPVNTEKPEPETDDLAFRKKFIADIKKTMSKPGRILKEEIVSYDVPSGMSYPVHTAFAPDMKRTLIILNEGEGNIARFQADLEGFDKLLESGPVKTENVNGYCISKYTTIGPVNTVYVGVRESRDVKLTILVFIEKDEKAYAEYVKLRGELDEKNKKTKKEDALKYASEDFDWSTKTNRIYSYTEEFKKYAATLLAELKSGHSNWSSEKYIDQFNRLLDESAKLSRGITPNLPSWSSSNPNGAKYSSWKEKYQSAAAEITRGVSEMKEAAEESRSSGKAVDYYKYMGGLNKVVAGANAILKLRTN